MPALNGGMTLSLQQEGRVTAIAVTPGEKVQAGQHLLEFSASASSIERVPAGSRALFRWRRRNEPMRRSFSGSNLPRGTSLHRRTRR